MATEAARAALAMSDLAPDQIDLVIIGTVTPDYRVPATACLVQERLGLVNAVAFDIAAACTGFISGLTIASSFISSGQHTNALVVGAEKLSSITNWNDRGTCILFGDAAGAAVVTGDDSGRGLLASFMRSDGRYSQLLWQKVGGTAFPYTPEFPFDGSDKLVMNGSEVFKVAVREMANAAERVVADAGIDSNDIALIVPHQANIRIIEALAKRMKVSMDRVYLNIDRYGNTSAASVPLAMERMVRHGEIPRGGLALQIGFGAGLSYAAQVVVIP